MPRFKAIIVSVALAVGAGLAIWANLPEPDPWAEVPAGQPHPRMGARVTIAPGTFVHLPPMALAARNKDGPDHWRMALGALDDAALAKLLPVPDQQESGPDGRVHRFWYNWCPDNDSGRWVVHLWSESRAGNVIAVHLVSGGCGVLVGEKTASTETAEPPPSIGVTR